MILVELLSDVSDVNNNNKAKAGSLLTLEDYPYNNQFQLKTKEFEFMFYTHELKLISNGKIMSLLTPTEINQIIQDLSNQKTGPAIPSNIGQSITPSTGYTQNISSPSSKPMFDPFTKKDFVLTTPGKQNCECGAEKTYGVGTSGHSSWCPKYSKI